MRPYRLLPLCAPPKGTVLHTCAMSEADAIAREESSAPSESRARSRGRRHRNTASAARGRATRNTRRGPPADSSVELDAETLAPRGGQADRVEFAFTAPVDAMDGIDDANAISALPVFETAVPHRNARDRNTTPQAGDPSPQCTQTRHPRRATLVALDSDDESNRADEEINPGIETMHVSRVTFALDPAPSQAQKAGLASEVTPSPGVARDAPTACPPNVPCATEHGAAPGGVPAQIVPIAHLTDLECAMAERTALAEREAKERACRDRRRREDDERIAAEVARNRPDPMITLEDEVRRVVAIEASATSINVTHPGYLGDVVTAINASGLGADAARGRVTWGEVMDVPTAACEHLRNAIYSFAQDVAPCHISFVAPSVLRARIVNSVRSLRWDHQAPLVPFFRLLASPALVNSPHGTRLLQNKGAFVSDLEYAWAGLVASPSRPFFGHAQSRARSGGHWQHERTLAPWSAACAPASYSAYMSAMIRHAKMWDSACVGALVRAVCRACDGVRKRGNHAPLLASNLARQYEEALPTDTLNAIAAAEERDILALTKFEQRVRSMLKDPTRVVDECEKNLESHRVAQELRALAKKCSTRDVFSSGISNVTEWTTAYRRCMPLLARHIQTLRVFHAIAFLRDHVTGTATGCNSAFTARVAATVEVGVRDLLSGVRLSATTERVTRDALATVDLSAQDIEDKGARVQALCCSAIAELCAFPAGVIKADVSKFESMMRLTETERALLGEACRHMCAEQLARAEAALLQSFPDESLDLLRLPDTTSQPLIRQMGTGAKLAIARAMVTAIMIK